MKKVAYTHESQKALTVEWYTPPWVFDALNIAFDLDPCHPADGVPWFIAHDTVSLPDDGLASPWRGTVWLNPPYGKETPQWLHKMSLHRDGIALVFSRTECKWFHDYVTTADAVLFMQGRIQFIAGDTLTKNTGSTCGSVLVAWGERSVNALRDSGIKGKMVIFKNYEVPA